MAGGAGPDFGGIGGMAGIGEVGGMAGIGEVGGMAGLAGTYSVLGLCDPAASPKLDGPLARQTEDFPQASVSGDWNRDGKLDLATANSNGSVSVLFGSGDGAFASSVSHTSGVESMLTGTGSIATLDLDGNGSLDLVVAHSTLPRLGVLLGTPDGGFASGVAYPVEDNPSAFTLGDFNGDGIADIAAAIGTGAVSVLLGHGDGTFGSQIVTPIGDIPKSIASGDLNHDGRLDVVTVGSNEVAVLLGRGAGSFVKAQVYESTSTHYTVAIADFDGDGHLDLVLPVTCSPFPNPQTWLEILLGRGDGTFSNRISYDTAPTCLEGIAVADINGDRAADLVTSPFSFLLGKGDGSFMPETINSKASGGSLLGLGDWNGDSKLDLASSSANWVAVHLGDGHGNFGSSELYRTGLEPHSLSLADLDQNGVLDVATADAFSYHGGGAFPSSVGVLLGAGDGTFLARIDNQNLTGLHYAAAAVDLNGDGWPDLVTRDTGSSIAVLLGTGDGHFSQPVTWDVGSSISSLVSGDLNGDGRPDLVATGFGPGTLMLMFGKGDGTFSAQVSSELASDPGGIALLDANGDAALDIAIAFAETGTVSVRLGKGEGSFAPQRTYATGAQNSQLTAADLNADGKRDLVTWGSDSISVLMGIGDGSFAPPVSYAGSASRLVAVNLDPNGAQDLVFSGASGITILFGAGDGTLTCSASYAPGLNPTDLAVGDLNRDGRMDVAAITNLGVNVFLNSTP
jgi:hypothetical protein